MEKALRSAVSYTFGSSANSKSNGKSKNSKSSKGDSKATREFIEKEIISTQTANEIKEMSQLTAFCGSEGQSYETSETSEEENEIECSQQQSGQETTMVGEPCYVSQECGQACLAVQEEDALSADENCQQQCGQQEENPVQQSTEVDVAITNIGEACYASQVVLSTNPIEVSQQSTVIAPEENAGVICAESQKDGQSLQEVVEESKIVEETKVTKKTSIVSQESQKVSQIIDQVVAVCDDNKDAKIVEEVKAVAKTADVSKQSQTKSQSISAAVSPCYAAEVISIPVEVVKQSTTATKSQNNVDTVDTTMKQIDSTEWCGVKKVSEIETKKEICQCLITKTTESHQESCKKAAVVEKCNENIEIEIKPTLNVEMSLEAKSKFSATIEEDSEVLITAKFVNPLSTPLTDGKFWIEADNLNKPYCFEIPHIDAGETVICRALIFPRCVGYEFIVARFVSREIKRIVGFTNIRCAASSEPASKIVVPKIVSQKVVATKKM